MPTTAIRKAAILLTSLPKEKAAELLGKLTPKQIESVSIEIAKLDAVTADEQALVIQEFGNANPNSLSGSVGGLEVAKNLVEQALGKAAGATIDSVRQSIEGLPFGFLQKVDSQNLLTFIIDEHPQTIALILSHIAPPRPRRSSPSCRRKSSCRWSAALPPWGRPARKSSARSRRGWSTACRA